MILPKSVAVVATGIVSPEGPAADLSGNVFLVSRWTGRVVVVNSGGNVATLVHTGGKPQAVAMVSPSEMLLADARNHALQKITTGGVLTTVSGQVEGRPFLGPNDLVVAEGGIVYMTDPGLEMDDQGRILRIEAATGTASILAQGLGFPNGITLSADGRHLMVAETVTRRILRFALLDHGQRLGPPEVFFQFPRYRDDGPDGPDGIAFDGAGNLLVALCGAGSIDVLSPNGTHLGAIPAGGRSCTNCVFGGEDFQTLYITEDDQQALLSTRWPIPGQRRHSRSLI